MAVDLNDIKNLVLQGETSTLEFKKSTAQLKRACETICAFLNGDGGKVIIGVNDKGQIIGQEISDKTNLEIGNEIAKISPHPNIEIIKLPLQKSKLNVIVIHVTTDATKRPYLYDGRAYIRVQSDNHLMSREYLQQLTLTNHQFNHQWEDQPLSDITINDLDSDEIINTIKEGVRNGRIPESFSTHDPELALEHLGLMTNKQITHAAFILFGKKPEKKFPQCLLRLARFRGTDKSEFIDNKQVYGNVFTLLKSAMIFANTHLPIASTFSKDKIERTDTPLFPISVLREAITNAICHRDYMYSGGSISFAIYDDRLEIWSYGLLPPGLSVEDLPKLNKSIPRNKRIANVLYYHKLFESWGRGIQLIIDGCIQAGHPKPIYILDSTGLELIMPYAQSIRTTIHSKQKDPYLALTQKQREVLEILEKYNGLSTNDIRYKMITPRSERWLRDTLNHLKKLGFIESKGQTTARVWFILR